jgi:uroporphyrinogen decarboxylase
MKLTSKQRVERALRREPVDRVPIFMWYHPETGQRLAQLLEIPAARVAEAMGDDIQQVWVNNNYDMAGLVLPREGDTHRDIWGIEWVREGGFNQLLRSPLAGASLEQVAAYRFPADQVDSLLSRLEPLARADHPCFTGCDVSPCGFQMYWRLRGMEQGMRDLAVEPEMAGALLARCGEFSRMLAEEACRRYRFDWVWTGDDVGGQQSMMMSPDMWREMIKPHLAEIFRVAREHQRWVAYHSDGAIRPIIPDLIEMGLHVLNPIQGNCPGMGPLELKRDFGDKLAFMGGVDTQGVLPHGTSAEVRRATRTLLDGMTAGGGGYILAASHTVPPETPDENLFAMYDEAGVSREEIFDRAADIRRGASGA